MYPTNNVIAYFGVTYSHRLWKFNNLNQEIISYVNIENYLKNSKYIINLELNYFEPYLNLLKNIKLRFLRLTTCERDNKAKHETFYSTLVQQTSVKKYY